MPDCLRPPNAGVEIEPHVVAPTVPDRSRVAATAVGEAAMPECSQPVPLSRPVGTEVQRCAVSATASALTREVTLERGEIASLAHGGTPGCSWD